MDENQDLLNYFIKHSNERFDKIEKKIDTLLAFKWTIVGRAGVIAGLISVALTLGLQLLIK